MITRALLWAGLSMLLASVPALSPVRLAPADRVLSATNPLTNPLAARSSGAWPAPRLAFEPNAGQADPEAQYLVRAPGGRLFFTQGGVVLALEAGSERHLLRWQFVDADPHARLAGVERLPGQVSYFVGSDASRWQRGLPLYAGVHYTALYPGIDLHYRGAGGQLKGTWVVAPGADPGAIRWRYANARRVAVGAQGELQVELVTGEQVTEQAPRAWQAVSGRQAPVAVRYRLQPDGTVGFAVEGYQPRSPLVIDPLLTYSSFLGGGGWDSIQDLAVGPDGSVYLVGHTGSSNFPLRDPIQPMRAGLYDVFVTRLTPAGSELVFSTYLGGFAWDYGYGIGVDGAGNVYVVGATSSPNFPIVNAWQPTFGGEADAFVAQLNPRGTQLVYSTFLGGGDDDELMSVVVDAAGRAYLAGDSASTNFPVVNPFQAELRGQKNAVIARLAPGGQTLEYSTYLGGNYWDLGMRLRLDAQGNVYLTGLTYSWDFPMKNAVQPLYGGGGDAYVAKLNAQGSALVYSTFLGGQGLDWGLELALAGEDEVYVTGLTESFDFPLANPFQRLLGGPQDAFVGRLAADGSALVYSTYLGGASWDNGEGIQIDRWGQAWVTGITTSPDFPLERPIQGSLLGGADLFVTAFAPEGTALRFSSYLGGTDGERPYALVLTGEQRLYFGGFTGSVDYPLAGQPVQGTYGGGIVDGFLSVLDIADVTPPTPTVTVTPTPQGSPTVTATAWPATPTGTSPVQRVYLPVALYSPGQP
jgi:hypothetical protein